MEKKLTTSNLSWKNSVATVDRCHQIIIVLIADMQIDHRCEIVAIKQILINAVMLSNCLQMSGG